MSSPSQTAAPSSIFKSMLDAALAEYQKKTGDDLLAHWLASELQTCESVDGVLNILRDQANAFEQSGDQKLMKWIDPLVHVLYTFSGALGDGVSLTFPPAKVIFTGIGILLAAAKDVRASHDAIIDLFERIESFFKRLRVYTQISLTTEMAEVLVKIVIELLSILSIATKEVKRRRAKIFARKLLGRTDIEDALKRLDSLIQEEFQMVTTQILKITTEVKDGADKANVDMQQDMEEVRRDVLEIKRDVVEVKSDVEEVKWIQIEQDIHKWLSPPDPSTNYNIAYKAHYEGTAAWFFQSKKFQDWTSTGSLLWIHGKPGSGKSVLCSATIKHVMSLRDAGGASLAFFYFDFRDKDKKQDLRNFVASLLVQLSAYSNPYCKIISRIYSTHGKGMQQPSDDALIDCLRKMISLAAQQSIYIIVDALDECPDSSGMPTQREAVLDFLEGLVRLGLPGLHICVTSRPEIDIKRALEPLPHSAVSLHDEGGQKKDISDYVSSVVYADRKMQSWRDEEKKLVVEELSHKADGMFRWVFCQLEVLRHCFPANIRQTLRELPETLDETYARVLRDINKTNQGHAHRMLQCLVVAIRPLHVEELAELLAFEFDAAQGGIPKYRATWRLDDETQAVLSTCSSLVTIVNSQWPGHQVVQFSHFSVKEFLMSDRLTSPLGDFSRYHIRPGSAHTILTQACLGSLLHLNDHTGKVRVKGSPLAGYAAQYWVKHAQFEGVASRVKDGMETLFDSEKPYFSTWIGIYNMDNKPFGSYPGGTPTPLYYSVLCGFYDLVKHLATKHPWHVNTICGQYRFLLLAALSEGYVEVAELLLEHGANVNVRATTGESVLLTALLQPQRNIVTKVKFLLKHGADVNVRDGALRTSLHLAEYRGELEVAEMLIKHKSDTNSQDNYNKTPLHILLQRRIYKEGDVLNHVRSLIEHGAEANRRDKSNETPLLLAMGRDWFKLAQILLEHGADPNAKNNNGMTSLNLLLERWLYVEEDILDQALLLLKHGTEANRRDKNSQTPLLLAMGRDWFKLARMFLERGADASVENNNGKTPLHLLSESRIHDEGDALDLIQLLLEHGAAVNRRDKSNQTPLHLAMGRDWFKLARILLEHGADASAKNNNGENPLHLLSESRVHTEGSALDFALTLLERGAAVNGRDKNNETPLHLAMRRDWFMLARILLKHGADANAENNNGETPLQVLIKRQIYDKCDVGDVLTHTKLWLEHGGEVDRRYSDDETPLLLEIDAFMENNTGGTLVHQISPGQYGSRERSVSVAQLLLQHGVDINTQVETPTIPSHLQSNFGPVQIAQALLHHGANVNPGKNGGETSLYQGSVHLQNKNHWTPLHLTSLYGRLDIARVLLDHGAIANSEDKFGRTPLHLVAKGKYNFEQDRIRIAPPERSAGVDEQDGKNVTPLHLASYDGRVAVARVLLDCDAAVNSTVDQGRTPLHLVVEGKYLYSKEGGIRVAQLLLERGADVNALDEDSRTPLHLASYYGSVEIAQVLLDGGATINSKCNQGRTPLHTVAEGGDYYSRDSDVLAAQLLLERGADANVPDDDNQTPLHLASYFGRVEMVLLLLNAGANASTKDAQGRTPLHIVSQGPYYSHDAGVGVAQLLLTHGADVNAQDNNHATPSDLASYRGRSKIAPFLLNYGDTASAGIN